MGEEEYSILNEIFSEAGIVLASFLLSGRSTKRMYQLRGEMRRRKNFSRRRALENLKKQGYVKIEKERILLTKMGEQIYRQNKIIKSLKSDSKK